MNATNQSQSETTNALEVFTFNYSESKQLVRTLLVDGEVFFVGSDVAKTLGYKKPQNAIAQHCRYALKRSIPHPQSPEKKLQVLTIPEGDVFRLIINSELPSAQVFESWVMDELLPTLRKKGYYSMNQQKKSDFIDARDIPFVTEEILDFNVRTIMIEKEKYYSINDINAAIRSSTNANQLSKKLNVKKKLAHKIWIFGNTHPAWFVNKLGFQLILSGSRIYNRNTQLSINFDA